MGFEPMPSVEDQNSLSYLLLIQEQGIYLESGALDHSAILTCLSWLELCMNLMQCYLINTYVYSQANGNFKDD
jgi:hypothetical protein